MAITQEAPTTAPSPNGKPSGGKSDGITSRLPKIPSFGKKRTTGTYGVAIDGSHLYAVETEGRTVVNTWEQHGGDPGTLMAQWLHESGASGNIRIAWASRFRFTLHGVDFRLPTDALRAAVDGVKESLAPIEGEGEMLAAGVAMPEGTTAQGGTRRLPVFGAESTNLDSVWDQVGPSTPAYPVPFVLGLVPNAPDGYYLYLGWVTSCFFLILDGIVVAAEEIDGLNHLAGSMGGPDNLLGYLNGRAVPTGSENIIDSFTSTVASRSRASLDEWRGNRLEGGRTIQIFGPGCYFSRSLDKAFAGMNLTISPLRPPGGSPNPQLVLPTLAAVLDATDDPASNYVDPHAVRRMVDEAAAEKRKRIIRNVVIGVTVSLAVIIGLPVVSMVHQAFAQNSYDSTVAALNANSANALKYGAIVSSNANAPAIERYQYNWQGVDTILTGAFPGASLTNISLLATENGVQVQLTVTFQSGTPFSNTAQTLARLQAIGAENVTPGAFSGTGSGGSSAETMPISFLLPSTLNSIAVGGGS